jgi:5-methylthioadenosine/S-adenosylhomocysteine deaminase
MTDFLLRGGCVLSLSSAVGNHAVADVLIEAGRISEIGARVRAPRGVEVIDATDTIVMPGFVDAHRHVWESMFCSLGHSMEMPDAPSVASVYGPQFKAEDVYASTLLGLLRGLEAGTTTVVDWFDAADEHVEAALQAHDDAGVRSVFVKGSPAWGGDSRDWAPQMRRLNNAAIGARQTLAAGAADPSSGDFESVSTQWSIARELGLRIHARVGKDPFSQGVVASLASRGMLGTDVTLAHCTHLSDADLDAIASSGAGVVLTPSTEMAEGLGSPPLQRLIDRKIKPGLGVGGEQVAPGDMFAQMRAVISLQHAAFFDLKLAGKGGLPRLLTTREIIRWATSESARVAGLGGEVGTLEPGRVADVVMLRADRPNIAPVNDPIGAVVWGMDTSNVDWVFVGGKPLMREGELSADVDRVRRLALESRDRVAGASGLLLPTGVGQ